MAIGFYQSVSALMPTIDANLSEQTLVGIPTTKNELWTKIGFLEIPYLQWRASKIHKKLFFAIYLCNFIFVYKDQ